MTTIAYKDGVLAADRLLDEWLDCPKIFALKGGAYVAGSGNYDDIVEVVAWLKGKQADAERPAITPDENDLLYVDGTGAYWLTDPFLKKVKITDPFYAVGTGAKYALGAMASGKTAIEAVAIAMKFDANTGGGIDSITVPGLLPGRMKRKTP